jgi:hypothetical protein
MASADVGMPAVPLSQGGSGGEQRWGVSMCFDCPLPAPSLTRRDTPTSSCWGSSSRSPRPRLSSPSLMGSNCFCMALLILGTAVLALHDTTKKKRGASLHYLLILNSQIYKVAPFSCRIRTVTSYPPLSRNSALISMLEPFSAETLASSQCMLQPRCSVA